MESIPPSPFTKGTLKAELLSIVEEKKRKDAEDVEKESHAYHDFVERYPERCRSALAQLYDILKEETKYVTKHVSLETKIHGIDVRSPKSGYQIICVFQKHVLRYLVENLREEGFSVTDISPSSVSIDLSCLWQTDPPEKEPEPENKKP